MNLIEYVMYLYAAGVSGIQHPFAIYGYKGSQERSASAERRNHVALGGELENIAA